MIAGYTTLVTLRMADNHTISGRVEVVFLAEKCKQLYSRIIGALGHSLCSCRIGAGKGSTAGVLDAGRLTHFHADVGVVRAAATMPATMVPRQGLVNGTIVAVNETVDAGTVVAFAVPVLYENRSAGLRTANGVEHQTLYGDFLPGFIARVLCQNRFNQLHIIYPRFLCFQLGRGAVPRCPLTFPG